MEQKKRVEYIDCLRGVTMLLVVIWHVYDFVLNTSCTFLDVLSAVRMPLFFFVSGLFVHFNLSSYSLFIRINLVLIPTITTFLLYIGICADDLNSYKYLFCTWFSSEFKGGYWFTISMIIMNCIHYLVTSILNWFHVRSRIMGVISLFIAVIGVILLKDWDYTSNNAILCRLFSLRLIAMYFPFYILGIVCKDNWDVFCRIIQKQWVISIALVSFLLLFFLPFGGFYKGEITSFCGVLFVYSIFNTYSDFFSTKTKVGTWLSYIGRHTLPIYLLHYFILRGIHLSWMGEQIALDSQWFLVFVLAFVITVLIVSACLIINSIVAVSTPIHRLFLGK